MKNYPLSPLVLYTLEILRALKRRYSILKVELLEGLASAAAEAAERLLRDPVTGLWNAQYRFRIVDDSRRWTAETGLPACYIEVDIRNVGGANGKLGHQMVNRKVFRPMASMFVAALEEIARSIPGAWYYAFRHGGDELSAVVGGVAEGYVKMRMKQLVRDSEAYAGSNGLGDIPHPKCAADKGVGLKFGMSTICLELTAEQIFSYADLRTEWYKAKRRLRLVA